MAMREISVPEFKLLDVLDRVVNNAMPKPWLKASTRAMASRMVIKGYLHKKDWRRGWVRTTEFGRRHWAAYLRKTQ